MKSSESTQRWIEAGYELFASDGPDGVQVEKLARKLDLNKSGFYHHFGDRDVFFSMLMEHHYLVNGHFYNEILSLKRFDPDYINLLIKYKTAICVQAHLKKNVSNTVYKEEYLRNKLRNDKAVVPLWAAYLNIPDNQVLAQELWEIIRDVFFMRFNRNNLSYELIHTLVYEFAQVVEVLKHYDRNSNPFRRHTD